MAIELLLDQGLPRSTVAELVEFGIVATHVGELGMADASDPAILKMAVEKGLSIVSLDSDFHTLLAVGGATGPSVVRLRVEALKGHLIRRVLEHVGSDLDTGAVASVTESNIRVRSLPIGAKPR